MDALTIQLIYGIIGAVIGVIGALAVAKKQQKEDGTAAGMIASDLGYLKKGVDDINTKLERLAERYHQLSERVAKVESSAKQAHRRIDRLDGTSEALHD